MPGSASQSQASPIDQFMRASMVIKIIVVTAIAYLADNLLAGGAITEFLGFHNGLFTKHFRLWEPFTYVLTHSPMEQSPGIWHLAFNMYNLWLFGRPVENRYGSRELLVFYIVTGAGSALIWLGLQYGLGVNASGLIGASGAVTAVVILFALTFPQQKLRLIFPPITVPAWALGLFIVGMDVNGAMGRGSDNVAFTVHLAGAVLALAYYYSGFSFTKGSRRTYEKTVVKKKQQEIVERQTVARHTCTICGITNIADKKMQFRYCSKCSDAPCFCEEHIGNHEHKVADQQQPSS